jgi:hypothetical protein
MKKIIVLADRSQTSPSGRSCCALASRVAQPPLQRKLENRQRLCINATGANATLAESGLQ